MNERQENILRILVEEYIASAEPVGSGFLVNKHDLGVSPATVRNDMVLLEKNGYLRQPHTSAGRIPTEKGYQFYLEHFVAPQPKHSAKEAMKEAMAQAQTNDRALKQLAKILVELSGETVVVGFGPHRSYCTGVSNLFAKPDFQDLALMQAVSEIVDRFDEVVGGMYDLVAEKPEVFLGEENPFGKEVSTVMVRFNRPNGVGVLGLVGPMRMDYSRNLQLIQTAHDLLEEFYG